MSHVISEKVKHARIGKPLFIAVLLLYSAVMLLLFYLQAIQYQDRYLSDIQAYIMEAQGIETGFDFPYPILFWLTRVFMVIFTPQMAMAAVTAILNSIGVIVVKQFFDREMKKAVAGAGREWNFYWDFLSTFLTFVLFTLAMLCFPAGTKLPGIDYRFRCLGTFTPNAYWNTTYMATRPFAILCFLQGIRVLEEYEKKYEWKQCLLLGLWLLLTTMTKPSFTFVLVPAFGIIMAYRLVKNKCRTFKNTFLLGLWFLPTGAALLYQYFSVFTGTDTVGDERGIGFAIGKVWNLYSPNIVLSIVLGLALPIFVFCVNYRRYRDMTPLRFAWQLLLVGAITFLCLYEKGRRWMDMNFSWGYVHGMFFVQMISILLIVQNTLQWFKGKKKIVVCVEWGLLLLHWLCGMDYFLHIMKGRNFGLY